MHAGLKLGCKAHETQQGLPAFILSRGQGEGWGAWRGRPCGSHSQPLRAPSSPGKRSWCYPPHGCEHTPNQRCKTEHFAHCLTCGYRERRFLDFPTVRSPAVPGLTLVLLPRCAAVQPSERRGNEIQCRLQDAAQRRSAGAVRDSADTDVTAHGRQAYGAGCK